MSGAHALRRIALIVAVLVGAACSSAERGGDAPLHVETIDQRNPDGKDLRITLRELRRDAATSEIAVDFQSGGSVASSLFIVKGMYRIAKLRGTAYFVKLNEWEVADGQRRYLVGFTDDDRTPVERQFPGMVAPGSEPRRFLSVKQYATLFERR